MKNLILTMCLLLVVSLTYAQLHVTKNTDPELNGAVGIGLSQPEVKLDIRGNLRTGENSVKESFIQIGKNRTSDYGSVSLELYPLKNRGAMTSFTSKKEGQKLVTTFIHQGNGHFQLATTNPSASSSIRFVTYDEDSEKTKTRMSIMPGSGYVGIGTKEPVGLLHVNGDTHKPGGGEWDGVSDKRTKKNINPYKAGLEKVLKINPVTYNYNGKAGITNTETTHIGLIAQEFAKIEPSGVKSFNYTEEGSNKTEEFLSMNASSVKYMLVNAVKEQQALIEAQKTALETLKTEVAELKANGASISTPGVSEMSVLLEGSGAENALLAQNSPNPFTTNTRIEYFIPSNSRHSRMSFRDMNGKEIKQVNIDHDGIGAIELSAKDLAGGIYSYVLYVNGDIVASKKMILRQ